MTSTDKAVLIEILDIKLNPVIYRLENVEAEISDVKTRLTKVEGEIIGLKAEMRETRSEIRGISRQIDTLQYSMGWVLGVVGIFLAFITFVVTCFAFLTRDKTNIHTEKTGQIDLDQQIIKILKDYKILSERPL